MKKPPPKKGIYLDPELHPSNCWAVASINISDKMLGRIFMLISIVVVVQPLSFCNITSSDQKHPAFTIYTVSYTFTILLLLTIPAQVECILGIVFVGTNFLSK